jgi:uncharacterized protein YlxP (DUF503 family)
MTVGLLTINIHLHGIASLKEKRRIVKSIIGRVKNKFNFSVAEVDAQDSKALAVIGLAVVANKGDFVNKQLDTVINFINADGRFYGGQIQREIFSQNN